MIVSYYLISLLSTGHIVGMEQRQDGEEFFLYWGGGGGGGGKRWCDCLCLLTLKGLGVLQKLE